MLVSVLDEAKRLYPLSPCRCKTCKLPLPFYHHRDHLCELCIQADIERDFAMFDLIRKEVIDHEETDYSEDIPF